MQQASRLTLVPLFLLSKVGGNRLVVLLSPPDVDGGVSESVCQLGSMLCTRGFRVSVDQWSIKEQCTLGPLPWLHSQLLELNSQGGRVVLVVTRKALERAEEWTHWHKEDIKTKGQENRGLPLTGSPYSDVFMASLCLIEADRLQGRAGERFLLATFDPHPRSDRNLPELLQGLRLFQLPSQTGALLTELTVGGTGKGSWKRWCLRWMDSRDYREGRRASYCWEKLETQAVEAPIDIMLNDIVHWWSRGSRSLWKCCGSALFDATMVERTW